MLNWKKYINIVYFNIINVCIWQPALAYLNLSNRF